MKKQRQRFSSVIEIIVILLLVALMTVIGVFTWNLISKKPVIDDPVNPNETVQTFEFSVNEFTLFEIEEFGFDFILANIHVDSNKPINLSLSHFVTSEQIQLSSVDQYLNTIETSGYTFGDYKLVFGLNSSSHQLDALLFIPVLDQDLTNIDLNINLSPKTTLSFDLNDPTYIGTKTDLGVSEVITEPEKVSEIKILEVSSISKSHFYILNSNGEREDAFFSSNSKIVGVKLSVLNKTQNPFRIQNAILISSDSNKFALIDSSYLIDGFPLIMNKLLSDSNEGFIFFEIFDQNYDIEKVTEIQILLSSMDVEKLYIVKRYE